MYVYRVQYYQHGVWDQYVVICDSEEEAIAETVKVTRAWIGSVKVVSVEPYTDEKWGWKIGKRVV